MSIERFSSVRCPACKHIFEAQTGWLSIQEDDMDLLKKSEKKLRRCPGCGKMLTLKECLDNLANSGNNSDDIL